MRLEPFTTIGWAYQLHYYLCFRTHRRRDLFATPARVETLAAALTEIGHRHDYHLLRFKVYPDHFRGLFSLRPQHAVATVIRTLKTNLSRAFCAEFGVTPPLWARGYLARSVPDHLHLLVRTVPTMSMETCVLSLMNNGQYFMGKHFPSALAQKRLDRLWQASAYAGTCGRVMTALVKTFLGQEDS